MSRSIAFVVVATLAAAFLWSTSVAAATPPPLGYTNDQAILRGQYTDAQWAAELSQAGAKLARVEVDWEKIEPTNNSFSWGYYDSLYQQLISHGVKPVLLLMGSPSWVVAPQESLACSVGKARWGHANCFVPPDENKLNEWVDFVRRVTARYPEAAAIEVWNEPNLDSYWYTGADPRRYERLLCAANVGVDAVDPSKPVVTAGLAPTQSDQLAGKMAHDQFLRAVYADGGRACFDAVGLHPYPAQLSPSAPGAPWPGIVQSIRNVMAEFGDLGTHLWFTEIGVYTGTTAAAASESNQASWLVDAYQRSEDLGFVDAFIVHTFIDPGTNPATTEDNFGVVRHDYSHKPAYDTLRNFAAGP